MLFFEQREDLAVSFFRERPPAAVHTFWSGISSRGPRLVYQADPTLTEGDRLEWGPPSLSIATFERLFSDFTQVLARERPGLVVSARGIGFEQRVMIARHGQGLATDLRRGLRLRFEGRLEHATAVAELLLPAGSHNDNSGLAQTARLLAERVESRLKAAEVRAGHCPVVFAPGVGGVLVHEIVGHALEADTVLSKGSWLTQLEEPIAPRQLTVLDDPRRGRAAWRIDDEAEPARAVPLIRQGVVAGWLHDSKSARRSNRPATGHGRCSSFREAVRPRMGCTFIAPGSFAADELLLGIEHGVYVRRMEAGNTDTRTGRALFRVTDSDRIQHGKLERPLRPHLLAVEGAEVLASMDRVADDLQFDSCIGLCHRDGQPLAISVGAPTIRIGGAAVK
jgi:TldD protein